MLKTANPTEEIVNLFGCDRARVWSAELPSGAVVRLLVVAVVAEDGHEHELEAMGLRELDSAARPLVSSAQGVYGPDTAPVWAADAARPSLFALLADDSDDYDDAGPEDDDEPPEDDDEPLEDDDEPLEDDDEPFEDAPAGLVASDATNERGELSGSDVQRLADQCRAELRGIERRLELVNRALGELGTLEAESGLETLEQLGAQLGYHAGSPELREDGDGISAAAFDVASVEERMAWLTMGPTTAAWLLELGAERGVAQLSQHAQTIVLEQLEAMTLRERLHFDRALELLRELAQQLADFAEQQLFTNTEGA